jgi:hypothetical protein
LTDCGRTSSIARVETNDSGFWLLVGVSALLAFSGAWVLLNGLINLTAKRPMVGGLSPWIGIVTGVVAIVAWSTMLIWLIVDP